MKKKESGTEKPSNKKNKKFKLPVKKIFKWLGIILVLAILYTFYQVISLNFINPKTTNLMKIRQKESLQKNKKIKTYRFWKPLSKISPHLRKSVIAAEDAHFYEHFGFDFKGMENAMKKNKKSKKVKFGGSTITQQLAKNLFLWPGRSYLRKGLEAYYSLLLEIFLSKNRILEIYLNVIEWGNGIFGAEAASLKYYKISSESLSPMQAATLAVIIPNPRKYKLYSNYILKRKKIIRKYSNDVKLEN
ncbi:MAG TPA: monofunctional biosynthetic peptidoglycan transglycosylase [bacterium]|nr:monofunctional biosynthetic peptidoglycan transglycosylase [bacterium]HPN29921.1 monofunctional biosynthetic peptidoglycan transglycosylase [bacterium]